MYKLKVLVNKKLMRVNNKKYKNKVVNLPSLPLNRSKDHKLQLSSKGIVQEVKWRKVSHLEFKILRKNFKSFKNSKKKENRN